jgi:hypothetical protein
VRARSSPGATFGPYDCWVTQGLFFGALTALPRGRHRLTREQVLVAQRERVMAAITELMGPGPPLQSTGTEKGCGSG